MLTALLALSLAHAASPVSVSVGTGGGLEYGIAGAQIEAGLRAPSGAGVSAHLGAGITAAAGGHLWLPGQKVRVGAGASVGVQWSDIGYSSGSCTYTPHQKHPEPTWGVAPSLFGADIAVDHDIGEPGRLSMRYGLGAMFVVAGCAGGFLPLPTVALSYRF